MPITPRQPALVRPGDRVAVLSPSWAAPQHFPDIHEQAMRRLREEIGVEPVEYPTTRQQGSPRERARDLNAAFADPSIRAILATIGGDDQITVLPHLDPALPQRDPKPFIGYSDNTNLLNWLWFHGVASVHGGSTQVHLGPGPRPDDVHLATLKAALFGGEVELLAPSRSRDVGIPWDDPRALTDPAPDEEAEGWTWSGPERKVTGTTWGGNIEIVQWNLAAGRWIHDTEAYAECVLLLEASEEMPPGEEIYRMLRNMGERGLLDAAGALVWARPPVTDHTTLRTPEDARAERASRSEAVLRAVGEYNPDLVVALDVEFGHTIPQVVLPYGGRVTVDGAAKRITADFTREG